MLKLNILVFNCAARDEELWKVEVQSPAVSILAVAEKAFMFMPSTFDPVKGVPMLMRQDV